MVFPDSPFSLRVQPVITSHIAHTSGRSPAEYFLRLFQSAVRPQHKSVRKSSGKLIVVKQFSEKVQEK